MKKTLLIIPAMMLAVAVTAVVMAESYYRSNYTPVYMKRADLEGSVSYKDTQREMVNPGKIYVKGTTIYVNEKYKGVHIIDNSYPASPRQTGFIQAPGCLDMAVKDNVIYLDNAVDMVAFNLDTKRVTKRIRDFFPPRYSPDGDSPWRWNYGVEYVLVEWKKNDTK